mmetsp:Transcript_46298/g.130907  ORF Transcript_46298/g.130907 Transcript_46298/m.130907 type:complete len:204 (+) Transcript_46298:407-1018(+)
MSRRCNLEAGLSLSRRRPVPRGSRGGACRGAPGPRPSSAARWPTGAGSSRRASCGRGPRHACPPPAAASGRRATRRCRGPSSSRGLASSWEPPAAGRHGSSRHGLQPPRCWAPGAGRRRCWRSLAARAARRPCSGASRSRAGHSCSQVCKTPVEEPHQHRLVHAARALPRRACTGTSSAAPPAWRQARPLLAPRAGGAARRRR